MQNEKERIALLDIIRGIAVLGILLMNIRVFSEPSAAYFNPLVYHEHAGLNKLWFQFQFLFADQKFMAIFSMLFGASTAIICDGLARRSQPVFGTYAKRIFGLLLIGLIHAYLLWQGDILVPYALGAIIPFIARNWNWRVTAALGVLLLAFGSIMSLGAFESISSAPPHIQAKIAAVYWHPDGAEIAAEIAAYTGSYMDHLPWRAEAAFSMQTDIFVSWGLWRIGGMMLLGLALYRQGFLRGHLEGKTYGIIALLCLPIGWFLVTNGLISNEQAGWTFPHSFFKAAAWNYWGSALVAIGYISVVGWLLKSTHVRFGFKAFANVGRAALSNYLFQSVAGITIFYGFGLGLFGQLERYQTIPIILGIWAAQLWLSTLWFKHHDKGPIEAIWHKFTYSRWFGRADKVT